MRELKFRAWLEPRWDEDDDANKMYYDIQNSYDTLGDVKPRDIMDSFSSWLNEENATVEQYTGLKDKNGKEIYEGDIVRYLGYTFYDEKKDWREVPVEWGIMLDGEQYIHDAFQTYCTVIKRERNEEYGEYINGESLIDIAHKCEVIGNIHENKEFLDE